MLCPRQRSVSEAYRRCAPSAIPALQRPRRRPRRVAPLTLSSAFAFCGRWRSRGGRPPARGLRDLDDARGTPARPRQRCRLVSHKFPSPARPRASRREPPSWLVTGVIGDRSGIACPLGRCSNDRGGPGDMAACRARVGHRLMTPPFDFGFGGTLFISPLLERIPCPKGGARGCGTTRAALESHADHDSADSDSSGLGDRRRLSSPTVALLRGRRAWLVDAHRKRSWKQSNHGQCHKMCAIPQPNDETGYAPTCRSPLQLGPRRPRRAAKLRRSFSTPTPDGEQLGTRGRPESRATFVGRT